MIQEIAVGSNLEVLDAAPVALNIEVAGFLPEVVDVGEEDGLLANFLNETLDSSSLLFLAGNGCTVGFTVVGPASLKDHDILARADLLQNAHRGASEFASLVGGGLGVEEGVDVGTDDIDGRAETLALLLPDVDGLSGGNITSVTGSFPGLLSGADETGQLANADIAVIDSLVTDNDQGDEVPLGPLVDGVHLLLGLGDTRAVDVDTNDHLQVVLFGGLADVLETVAVSGIDADVSEALLSNLGDVLQHGGLVLAVTVVGVGRVGHTHNVATGVARGGRGGSRSRGSTKAEAHADAQVQGGSAGGGGRRGGHRRAGAALRADVVVVGVGNSHGLLGLGVGTRGVGSRSRVDQHGAAGHKGGDGGNGVGASGGADVGSVLNDACHGGARGLHGSDGAGNGSRSLNDSGHTTNGVGAARDLSTGSTADGGRVGDGQGLGGDGVDTSGREAGDNGGGQFNYGSAGSGGSRSSRGSRGNHRRGRGGLNGGCWRSRGLFGSSRRGGSLSRDRGLCGRRGLGLGRGHGHRGTGRSDLDGDGAHAGRGDSGDGLRLCRGGGSRERHH